MKVTRYAASRILRILEATALGSLDDETLEAMILNFNAFRKVVEELESLKIELSKRLYGEQSKKSDEEKKRLSDFSELIRRIGKTDAEERIRLDALAKKEYPELYELHKKERATIVSLLNKAVDVEVKKVDGDELVKCVLKGKKDVSVGEVYSILSPMFEAAERPEAAFSEIDELLK